MLTIRCTPASCPLRSGLSCSDRQGPALLYSSGQPPCYDQSHCANNGKAREPAAEGLAVKWRFKVSGSIEDRKARATEFPSDLIKVPDVTLESQMWGSGAAPVGILSP